MPGLEVKPLDSLVVSWEVAPDAHCAECFGSLACDLRVASILLKQIDGSLDMTISSAAASEHMV
jgi:hypothetical protein